MTEADKNRLIKSFQGVSFNQELEEVFLSLWKEVHFRKNEWITEAGRTDDQSVFEWSADFNIWSHLFLGQILIGRVKCEVQLLTLRAKERYVKFMRRCPEVLLQIPQKYLAAYLNMTPETFSRFRSTVRY